MSCVFIRPVLPHGYLPSTDWDYPAATNYDSCDTWGTQDIVDADQLQSNWALIFSKANGMLDGTDFMPDSGQFDEETALVDYEQGAGGTWPTVGQRHSHNGIDSAKLADSCISQLTLSVGATTEGSYGMIRHPSESFHGVLMTHRVAYDQPSPGKSTAYSSYVAVPYNHKEWGVSYLQRSGASGRTAVLACPLMGGYSSWSVNQRCAASMMVMGFALSGSDITAVSANMQDLMGERVASNWTYGVLALACLAIS